jgi:type VII secretion integral membrane protein EccD
VASGLSRVTIVAPRSRVDLALPADVPMAEMMPVLLRYAGTDLGDDPAARHGWTLSRLDGKTLDSTNTPAQLRVRDGDVLYLRPRGDEAPVLVYDDVIDAVATGTREHLSRWTAARTRRYGLAVAVLALFGGAAVTLLAGPPQLPGGVVGLGGAAVLIGIAMILSRAVGDHRAARALGLVAVAYATVGGLLVLAGDRTLDQLAGPHLLIAVTAALLASVLAAVGIGPAATPVFLCTAAVAAAAALSVAASVALEVGPVPVASVAVLVALATLPAHPMMAYRMAGLPVPSLPAEREELRQDAESVDGERVLERVRRADELLAAMVTATAVVVAAGAAVVATSDWRGLVLAASLGLLLTSRARWYLGPRLRLPLLAGGAVASAAVLVGLYHSVGAVGRLAGVLLILVGFAGVHFGFALAGGKRPNSPWWGRALDILEIVLILGMVPLAIWVSGLFGWIRGIRG